MKVHRVVMMVVDHDEVGDRLQEVLESVRYPNRCVDPNIMQIDTREVEWSDDHPLNSTVGSVADKAFAELFKGVR